jgi:hypothetical protein
MESCRNAIHDATLESLLVPEARRALTRPREGGGFRCHSSLVPEQCLDRDWFAQLHRRTREPGFIGTIVRQCCALFRPKTLTRIAADGRTASHTVAALSNNHSPMIVGAVGAVQWPASAASHHALGQHLDPPSSSRGSSRTPLFGRGLVRGHLLLLAVLGTPCENFGPVQQPWSEPC